MSHQPGTISETSSPEAAALAVRARTHGLAIYAGAGLSLAEPTGLPSGASVAQRVAEYLLRPATDFADVDLSDLTAVADAVVALSGGVDAVRQTAARVAEFTSARPGYGHRLMALLLLEGVLDVLTTNWDDCIERGAGSERVPSVVNASDLLQVTPPSVLKIHGCATQPASLLVSTADLAAPPGWVEEQTRSRLGSVVVVFVGIGDVAGYVRVRLKEAIDDVGTVDNIRVVSPGISANWAGTQWAQLLPSLPVENRIPKTADQFLEELAGAYVDISLVDTELALENEGSMLTAFQVAAAGVKMHDALTALSWVRHSSVVPVRGASVLGTQAMTTALIALGKLATGGFRITRDRTLQTDAGLLELLVASNTQPASRLRREAQLRLEAHISEGATAPRFLVAGGIGWSAGPSALPLDILGDGTEVDIVDGPLNTQAQFIWAEELLN